MRTLHSIHHERREKGFILLLSVLITSVILAISFSIYSISLKELVLASFLKNSAQALVAADRGMECALYWDRAIGPMQNGMQYTIFATSSEWRGDTSFGGSLTMSNAVCHDGTADKIITSNAVTGWANSLIGAETATTDFSMSYSDGTCVEVTVWKDRDLTTITSDGYNTSCSSASARRTQRTVQFRSNL
jgi:hypothetical protein